MLSDDILLSLNSVPDEYLEQTWEKLNRRETAKKPYRKISGMVLIAAVIAALLTLSAFAAGYSFYKKHQANIREQLKIDENAVSGYVEYEYEEEAAPKADTTGTTETANIQLISSIDCGEYIKVYFCLSPVSPETFEDTFGSGDFDDKSCLFKCFAGNDERIGEAIETELRGEKITFSYDTFYASTGISLSEEELQEHSMVYTGDSGETYFNLDDEYKWNRISESYDEETQSLFLKGIIRKSFVDPSKPIYFTVGLLDSKSVTVPLGEHVDIAEWRKDHRPVYLENYGTAVITAACAGSRSFDLSNGFVELTNPSNNGKFKIMSASVYPNYIELKATHDDIYLINNLPEENEDPEAFRNGFEKQLEWTVFYDSTLQNSEILFADGGSLGLVPSDSVSYDNGIVTLRSYFASTEDISKVDKLKICGSVIPVI